MKRPIKELNPSDTFIHMGAEYTIKTKNPIIAEWGDVCKRFHPEYKVFQTNTAPTR